MYIIDNIEPWNKNTEQSAGSTASSILHKNPSVWDQRRSMTWCPWAEREFNMFQRLPQRLSTTKDSGDFWRILYWSVTSVACLHARIQPALAPQHGHLQVPRCSEKARGGGRMPKVLSYEVIKLTWFDFFACGKECQKQNNKMYM